MNSSEPLYNSFITKVMEVQERKSFMSQPPQVDPPRDIFLALLNMGWKHFVLGTIIFLFTFAFLLRILPPIVASFMPGAYYSTQFGWVKAIAVLLSTIPTYLIPPLVLEDRKP